MLLLASLEAKRVFSLRPYPISKSYSNSISCQKRLKSRVFCGLHILIRGSTICSCRICHRSYILTTLVLHTQYLLTKVIRTRYLDPGQCLAVLRSPRKSNCVDYYPIGLTDIALDVVSVQYSCDVLHSTANPSQTPMPLIMVVKPDPSVEERLIFCSEKSLQNMYRRLKWTSTAIALVNPDTTECAANIL